MPAIKRTPGILNKASKSKYINQFEKKAPLVKYSMFEASYRNKNLTSERIRLTSHLYSDLKYKLTGGKDFEIGDIDNPNVQIDDEMEKEYLKNQIIMQDDMEPVDSFPKELVGSKAKDNYYKHYKMIDRVSDQNKVSNLGPSIYTRLLKSTSQKRLLPIKFGVLRQSLNNSKSALNLK
jgi:hypothetical protein